MSFMRSLASPVVVIVLALAACRGAPSPTALAEIAPTPDAATPEPPSASAVAGSVAPRRRPAAHLTAPAVTVTAVDGSIVARDAAGHEAALTAEGTDDSPALSPDGKTVAFYRHPTAARGGPPAIYRIGVLEGEAQLLVAEEPFEGPHAMELPLADLGSPEFSVDGARVFFHVRNGDLGAICDVDLATGKVHWVLTAVETELIRKGPYRGHFFAIRREHDRSDEPLDERCYVLHSVTGHKLRAVPCLAGDAEATLKNKAARRAIGL
jgi:hypothetical protein